MTADEHPTKISAPQIAAAKRTIINFAPGLAPQSGVALGGTGCVLAAEIGLFFEIKSSAKCGKNEFSKQKRIDGVAPTCRSGAMIKKILLSAAVVLALATPSFAQSYCASYGTPL